MFEKKGDNCKKNTTIGAPCIPVFTNGESYKSSWYYNYLYYITTYEGLYGVADGWLGLGFKATPSHPNYVLEL